MTPILTEEEEDQVNEPTTPFSPSVNPPPTSTTLAAPPTSTRVGADLLVHSLLQEVVLLEIKAGLRPDLLGVAKEDVIHPSPPSQQSSDTTIQSDKTPLFPSPRRTSILSSLTSVPASPQPKGAPPKAGQGTNGE